MWSSYRLHSGLLLLLMLLADVSQAARKTQPDSSNTIADDVSEDPLDVFTDELIPTDSERNRSDELGSSGDLEPLDRPVNNNNNNIVAESDLVAGNATDWSTIWPYFNTGCLQWLPINHVYFQLANSFLFLSYLAPAGLYGLIYLRVMLAIGSAFFAIWGWVILCAFDTFLWNAFFLLINLVHVIYLLFSMRPVRFDKQVEEVKFFISIVFFLLLMISCRELHAWRCRFIQLLDRYIA